MKKIIFAAFLAIILVLPVIVIAADYLPKDDTEGGNVSVQGETEYRNLFVGGGNVAINKNILGDLFAAGGSVNVSFPVEDDLFAAAGNINISAEIGEDARIAGGNISVSSPIKGDLIAAAGTLNISKNSLIGGDFWAASGALNLNSNVEGNAKIAGGEIFINSEIKGNVEITADEKLTFGPNSKVLGEINYWGKNEAVIQEGAEVSQINFQKLTASHVVKRTNFWGISITFTLIKALSLLIGALLLIKLFSKSSNSLISSLYERPWKNLGIGFLGIILTPIVVILLMITVIGSYVGLVVLFAFILMLILSSLLSMIFIGSLAEKIILRKTNNPLTWKTALWGVLIGTIIGLIPFIGWLALCIVYLMTFGGLLQKMKSKLETK